MNRVDEVNKVNVAAGSMKVKLMGDINCVGIFDIPVTKTVKEILNEYGYGVLEHRRLKLVQVGGPYSAFLSGAEINKTIEELVSGNLTDSVPLGDSVVLDASVTLCDPVGKETPITIMYLSDLLCPVDYMRFLTRFTIREVRVDTEHTRTLNELIENMAQPQGNVRDFVALKHIIVDGGSKRAEFLLNRNIGKIVEKFEDEILEHIEQNKCRNGICRGLIVSQCINACPAEVHIPGYVALMKKGKTAEAYGLMRQSNPLSFVCGKICSRPCESRCRRKEIESTVGVRALQRYVGEAALEMNRYEEKKLAPNGKKVGIIGAGPAGLTSAYYLAKTGYEVTVYEAESVVGGMLAFGVPEYRLPYEDIYREVSTIKALGVEILTNKRVGRDITFDIIKGCHDAVLLATGRQVGNLLPGLDIGKTDARVEEHSEGDVRDRAEDQVKSKLTTESIETAIAFLRDVRLKKRTEIGNRVLVIGGGDVAMDAARTSVRLGAEKVMVASLESYSEMPASSEEKVQAAEEGVELLSGHGVDEITSIGAGVSVSLKKCIRVFDDEYRFSPVFDDSYKKTFDTDSVILAIGQKSDLGYLDGRVNVDRGSIKTGHSDFRAMTSEAGVFAAGDVLKPSVAIDAIASGKRVAEEIDSYLGGAGLYVGESIEIPEEQLNIRTWDDQSVHEPITAIDERSGGFCEVSHTLSVDDALLEASRCMRCDRNSQKPLLLTPRR